MRQPLLEVEGLKLAFGPYEVLHGISFQVPVGRRVALLGESGSGKSVTAMAVMGMLPGSAALSGSIRFEGRELTAMSAADRAELRGKGMTMTFQNAVASLNPVMRVGNQIADVIRFHTGATKPQSMDGAVELLQQMGIVNAEKRAKDFPHQLSGGMAQRALMALALAGSPSLLIADEPTSGLDAAVQAEVVDLLLGLFRNTSRSLLMITHDVSVVERLCTDVVIMYAGTVMEIGPVDQVLDDPKNPYTKRLLDSIELGATGKPAYIPGTAPAPSASTLPPGCPFAPRCDEAVDICHGSRPALEGRDRLVACHRVNNA